MRIEAPRAKTTPAAAIRVLRAEDIDQLRFGFWSRVSNEDVKRTIAAYPDRSVWRPDTLEYAIVSPWRHRQEIANVQELSAVRHPSELLLAVVERCEALRANMVVSVEIDEVREPAFYRKAGFALLEEVVTYELDLRELEPINGPDVEFRLVDPTVDEDRAQLRRIDQSSFPWLWWNCDHEFLVYGDAPGVEIHIVHAYSQPIGYIGITAYLGWGHLDRIAILPGLQGGGFGRSALKFAIARLVAAGARKIGLSTQRENTRSQRLYEAAGFRRSQSNDYRLYARMISEPEGVEHVTGT